MALDALDLVEGAFDRILDGNELYEVGVREAIKKIGAGRELGQFGRQCLPNLLGCGEPRKGFDQFGRQCLPNLSSREDQQSRCRDPPKAGTVTKMAENR